MSKKEKEFFNKLYSEKGYSWWGITTYAGKKRIVLRIKKLKKIINTKNKNLKILEVGCGIGDYTKYLRKYFNFVVASDLVLNFVKDHFKKLQNVFFVSCDAEKLPFKNKFDVVTGNAVLHHFNLPLFIKEVKKILVSNGKIIFFEPNYLNPQVFLEKKVPYLKKQAQNTPDEVAFVRWHLKYFLSCNGFKNVKIIPFDFLHPATPKKLTKQVIKISNFLEKVPLVKEISGSLIVYGEKK